MTLSSMTGFSRVQGQSLRAQWAWELKTVNAKGYDLRLRLPSGLEGVEAELRRMVGAVIIRGTVHAGFELTRQTSASEIRINEILLKQLAQTLGKAAKNAGLEPPSMDALLSIRGVVETSEQPENEEEQSELVNSILASLETAVVSLCASRQNEGAVLLAILSERIDSIAALVEQAESLPSRQPEAVKQRLSKQISELLETTDTFDPLRLHQEAMLLAVKADIREELDRLKAHCQQAKELLMRGGAIGRRLDFLSQELSRETNTLCAKSGDNALTTIGIDLKTLVEQFREQVQNVE
jgi:uncharacterized protein (TIGR00255 family)